jgi:hypothetical protein
MFTSGAGGESALFDRAQEPKFFKRKKKKLREQQILNY